jgi:hypothetical protein
MMFARDTDEINRHNVIRNDKEFFLQKMNTEANASISKGVVRNACAVLQLYTFTLAFRTLYQGNNHKALPVVLLLTRNSDGHH